MLRALFFKSFVSGYGNDVIRVPGLISRMSVIFWWNFSLGLRADLKSGLLVQDHDACHPGEDPHRKGPCLMSLPELEVFPSWKWNRELLSFLISHRTFTISLHSKVHDLGGLLLNSVQLTTFLDDVLFFLAAQLPFMCMKNICFLFLKPWLNGPEMRLTV